jgi:hypothetical protein
MQAKFIIGVRSASEPDNIRTVSEPTFLEIIIQSRDQFPPGEITRGAKNNYGSWYADV